MKSLKSRGRYFLFLLFAIFPLLFGGETLRAQNTIRAIIHMNDGTSIQVVIIKVGVDVVEYRLWDQFETNRGAYGPVREENKSNIRKIDYADGSSETFNVLVQPQEPVQQTPPVQQQVQTQQPARQQFVQESPIPEPVKPKQDFLHNGFCYGLKGGLFIPSNKTFSEIYGPGLMWGGSFGYWAGRWGIVFDYRMLSKKGDPYTTGQVSSATSKLDLFPLTFTNYFTIIKSGDFETYVGLGIGPCFYKEYLSMTAFGQSASATTKLTTFELNATFGMNVSFFYFEFSLLTIPLLDYNTNAGGFLFSVGFFL
jgi:hypothetical protein